MPWTNGAIWAVAGSVGTWLSGLAKAGFEHYLEQRKEQATEERAIRAEQRSQVKVDQERRRAESDKLQADADKLLMYKTQLNGCSDLFAAASVIEGLHSFFVRQPSYLRIQDNASFLEKYPGDLQDQIGYDSKRASELSLEQIKRDARELRVPCSPEPKRTV